MAVLAGRPVPTVRRRNAPTATIAVAPARPLSSPVPTAPAAPAPGPAPEPEPVATPIAAPAPQPSTELVAEVGEAPSGSATAPESGGRPPRVTRGMVGEGHTSRVIRLSGEEPGSELVLGNGTSGEPTRIQEGDEYALSFSFEIQSMAYGEPEADNVMVEITDEEGESRSFGLQLWQLAIGDPQALGRGLWASGEAMGGNRFLSALTEGAWHDVEIDLKASAEDEGFYAVFLDGQLIDARTGVSLIPSGTGAAQIAVGLLRDSTRVQGASELRFGPTSLEPLAP